MPTPGLEKVPYDPPSSGALARAGTGSEPLQVTRRGCTPGPRPPGLTLAEPYGLVRQNLIKRNRVLTDLQLNLKGFQVLNISI